MMILDHILIGVLLLVLPFEGVLTMRRLDLAMRAGDARARSVMYIKTMALEWALVAAVLAVWIIGGRPWDSLGVKMGGLWPSLLGVLSLGAIGGLLVLQFRSVQRLTDAQVARVRERQRNALALLPANAREHRLFNVLCVTAGVCEELLFRGYAGWYLTHWLNPWAAMLAASAVFGLAHAYQGRQGIVRTGVVGAMFGAIYLLSGSLLWPVIGHAAVDLAGGMLVHRLGGGGGREKTGAEPGPIPAVCG
ncbi:MAG: CPBP family intramembrane metalloprotease [Planctomycetes bacterium]|nr:CPBP family intramembrane metalloprotease [Planctomycetota bacterium]